MFPVAITSGYRSIVARERGQAFQVLLTRLILERLLYRLSLTSPRNRLVLKGAMLLTSWIKASTHDRQIANQANRRR